MDIKTIKVGFLEANCYIVSNNKNCIIIDPGDEYEKILENIKFEPIAILLTHSHFDHIGAATKIKNKYDIPTYDYSNLKEGNNKIGEFNIEVIYTKGHTDDSITYYFKDYNLMFTGDFLFKGTIGRTDLPTGDEVEMKNSINKIKNFSGNIKVFPGHGDVTNLEYEKQKNLYFK